MAITKTYITGSVDALYDFLIANGTDYFTSFVKQTDTNAGVSCYIGELEFVRLNIDIRSSGSGGVRITTSTGLFQEIAYSTNLITLQWAYKTSNALVFSAGSFPFSIVITKDNEGNTAVIVLNTFSPNVSGVNTTYAVSVNSDIIDTTALYPNVSKYTTAFCPLIVSNTSTRYTPNVFYMPFAQYSVEGTFVVDGTSYLCNGILAVKDE